jgi:hypothetical protein
MMVLNHRTRGSGAPARAVVGGLVSPGECPQPELLRAETEGVLPDDLAARVRAHRVGCALCACLQSALTDLDIDAPTNAERRRIGARIGHAPKRTRN